MRSGEETGGGGFEDPSPIICRADSKDVAECRPQGM